MQNKHQKKNFCWGCPNLQGGGGGPSRLGQNPKFVKGTYCGAPLTDSLKSRDANASKNPLLHLD